MRALVTFVLFSNLFIGASAAALTYATADFLLHGESAGWLTPAFVFAATLVIYNLDRLVGGPEAEDDIDSSTRHDWIEQSRWGLWLVVGVAAASGLVLALQLPWRTWWVLVPMGLVAVGYAVPVYLPGIGWWRLKEIPGLKMVLIVAVWAGATVLLPAAELELLSASRTWSIAALRGLFIFSLTLPFDLRDFERDARAGIRTIPHWIGRDSTTWLSTSSAVVFGTVAFLVFGFSEPHSSAAHLVTAAVSLPVLTLADVDSPEWYFVGVVDGMILVHAAALWTLR